MINNFLEVKKIDYKHIDALTRELSEFDKNKAIKRGLGHAGSFIKKQGLKRLQSSMKSGKNGVTGNLIRSFVVRVKKNRAGVLIGFTAQHAHFIDLGTSERRHKKGKKKYTGKVIGNFFWTTTKRQDDNQALNKIYEGIEKTVNKIKKRIK